MLTLLVSIERERWLEINGPRPLPHLLLSAIASDIRQELRREDDASRAEVLPCC